MVACFLLGELTSRRFGAGVRRALAAADESDRLLTDADLADPAANRARRDLLAAIRGFGENREVFEDFPGRVRWIRAVLTPVDRIRAGRLPGRGGVPGGHGSDNGPLGPLTPRCEWRRRAGRVTGRLSELRPDID
jgi:hypothetical protein